MARMLINPSPTLKQRKVEPTIKTMKETERIAYLKSIIEDLLALYFFGKKEPHKYDSFKDAKTITKAELAVNGLYHIAGSDEWAEHTFKSTFYDENNDIKYESSLKCKYQEYPCIVNDTVFGSSCSICRMNPDKNLTLKH